MVNKEGAARNILRESQGLQKQMRVIAPSTGARARLRSLSLASVPQRETCMKGREHVNNYSASDDKLTCLFGLAFLGDGPAIWCSAKENKEEF